MPKPKKWVWAYSPEVTVTLNSNGKLTAFGVLLWNGRDTKWTLQHQAPKTAVTSKPAQRQR